MRLYGRRRGRGESRYRDLQRKPGGKGPLQRRTPTPIQAAQSFRTFIVLSVTSRWNGLRASTLRVRAPLSDSLRPQLQTVPQREQQMLAQQPS